MNLRRVVQVRGYVQKLWSCGCETEASLISENSNDDEAYFIGILYVAVNSSPPSSVVSSGRAKPSRATEEKCEKRDVSKTCRGGEILMCNEYSYSGVDGVKETATENRFR